MKKSCKMCTDCNASTCECPCHKMAECCKGKKYYHGNGGGGDMVYCLGIIGAAIYFISNTTGFWMSVLGLLKAIVWPVSMVFEVFKFFLG